jgi:hypothetical protein
LIKEEVNDSRAILLLDLLESYSASLRVGAARKLCAWLIGRSAEGKKYYRRAVITERVGRREPHLPFLPLQQTPTLHLLRRSLLSSHPALSITSSRTCAALLLVTSAIHSHLQLTPTSPSFLYARHCCLFLCIDFSFVQPSFRAIKNTQDFLLA